MRRTSAVLALAAGVALLGAAGAMANAGPLPQGSGATSSSSAGGSTASSASATSSSSGGDASDQCVEAFADAQVARHDGKLLDARDDLVVCAQASCPEIVSSKCAGWLDEVKKDIPSVIVVAKGEKGEDLLDAEVWLDGALAKSSADGQPIELNPGAHDLEVRPKGLSKVDKRQLVVALGEKNRRVEVSFAPPPPPPAKDKDDNDQTIEPNPIVGVHPVTWIAFGVSIAFGITGGATGIAAISQANDLVATCGGTVCSESFRSLYDQGVRLATASTATFIIGGIGLATAAITLPLLYKRPNKKNPAITPKAGLGWVGVEGAF